MQDRGHRALYAQRKTLRLCRAGADTRDSGGKIRHGRLLHACNHYLQWAFIEAAWVAVGCSDYFGDFYRGHRARGKGANEAITITARRMCQIA